MQAKPLFTSWLKDIASIPWRDAAVMLRERFREDRLGLTASSLTFTTTIALVPLITVALAVFTAFPMFAKFQDVLQRWLIESLVPDNIARQVLGYLNQFAGKASRLGVAGLAILLGTALALIFTIDRTLNSIWRVKKRRPFGQRVLVYWAAVTLGPLLLGASLSITSYAITASKGVVGGLPGGITFLLDSLQFGLVAAGTAAMFHYVPNTYVRWGHAWMGGLFVSAGMELARKGLAMYLAKVPTYSVVYGAFATVPILLIWIYVAWVIVLLGAALTAYLPSLLAGVPRRKLGHGWQFQLALEVLQMLDTAKGAEDRGLTLSTLRLALRVDSQRLEPVLQTLQELDWVGQLQESTDRDGQARYVLLADLGQTVLEPLMQRLLLTPEPFTENLWKLGRWRTTSVREALQKE
ncbi:YihY family inner membrane protein [Rhodoferax sp. TBRC 17198]|jgi:membrane protein|uniref:YihY family inner membrane protein n=1 Tax=Rhodoferax potami TaxID=3068338 RepID=UPI0028BD361E|nr:YhjD/YihY/BrkB family envelope integrity protein [Rhodoferax sp. TBRC 17198]MDT7522483.1 YihY family inner membrane protein [Rhodoferax sp. TBRC 17198]